ncbi:MAG: NAD(P)H-dependent oxidoreductase [Deltaproteobacteria bacterium]|nr:NAD(P)H-dependent oxidoreductase [Deltaproteobacteria bacterium]
MTEIAVVYHSTTGTTKRLAQAVHVGAGGVAGARASLHAIVGDDIREGRFSNNALFAQLDAADAIIFGSPTFMGGPSAQLKAFLDATVSRWVTRAWANKLAAAFTVSATPSGDKLNTLTSIAVTAMQLGMIWVGVEETTRDPSAPNRLSVYMGAAGQADYGTNPPGVVAADLRTGELLGARVAKLALRLRANP